MSTRIFWKPDEIEAIAKRSYMIRKNSVSDISPLEAIRRAQDEVLPRNRLRDLTGMHQVQKVVDVWKTLAEQGYGEGSQVINPVVPPQHQPTPLKLEDVPMAEFMSEFSRRMSMLLDPDYIRSIAREEVNRVLEARIPGMFLQPDEPPVKPEEVVQETKVFHVCILGLEGQQKESLRREYGSLIDFHFLDGDEGVSRIKATCERMDLTVKSRWCKGNLGSTKGWPKFSSAEGGGLDTIKQLINRHFKL